MNWRPATLLPLVLLLAASCSSEGGSRGSGISTTVQGNVTSVQLAALLGHPRATAPALRAELPAFLHLATIARAQTAIAGIRVTVEGTGVTDVTDANGSFSLQGDFDGVVTLVFQLPEDGAAPFAINVPAGGTLILNNVRVDGQTGEVSAESQDVNFEGIITETDCPAFTLKMVSTTDRKGDVDQYTLRTDTSSFQAANGAPLTCADLRGGQRATVDGMVNQDDGTFGHAVVQLEN